MTKSKATYTNTRDKIEINGFDITRTSIWCIIYTPTRNECETVDFEFFAFFAFSCTCTIHNLKKNRMRNECRVEPEQQRNEMRCELP